MKPAPDGLKPVDLLLVLVVSLVWGGHFVAGSVGMQHFTPFLYMVLRFGFLLALLWPFLRLPPSDKWLRLVAVALFMGAFHFTLLFWALARSADVSSVAIVLQTYIPMAVLLAMSLTGERVGWISLSAVMMSFLGVLLVGFDPAVLRQPDVLAITLAAALFLALGSIYQRGLTGISVANYQAWTALIALPVMLIASLLTEQEQWETIRSAKQVHWASVCYSVLLASLVGHGLFFVLVQRNPVANVMPYLQLTPIIAVISGVLIWGDQPGVRLLGGGFLVISGILIITLRARKKAETGGKA
jgi:O-acetylserine/cysteine efflux transporter